MKAIVIGEEHAGLLTAIRLKEIKEAGIHILNVSSIADVRTCIEDAKITNESILILVDTEPIEIKRKPWLDEPMMFTKAPELQYSYSDAYERNSHKHPYKFHK